MSEEQASLRVFKESLMHHSAAVMETSLSFDEENYLERSVAEVENAYARVQEYAPSEAYQVSYAEVFATLKKRGHERRKALLPRPELVHMLAELDHYLFLQTVGYEHVYDQPDLTDGERAAEHSLRHTH